MKLLFTLSAVLIASTLGFSQSNLKKPSSSNHEKGLVWKPTKIEHANWNTGTLQFDVTDSMYYTYSPTTGRILTVDVVMNNIVTTKMIYSDVPMNKNQDYYYLVWNFGTSVFDTVTKELYTYDSYGNVLSKSYYSNGNMMNSSYTRDYTYNANNKPSSVIQKAFNTTSGLFENNRRTTYTYYGNGFMASESVEYFLTPSGIWENSYKIDYVQNGSGNYTTIVNSNWDNISNSWVYSGKNEYDYISPNLDIYDPFIVWGNNIYYEYNTSLSAWEPSDRYTETTLPNGGYEELAEAYITGTWTNYSKYVSTHNSFGFEDSYYEFYWNTGLNSWDTTIIKLYEYQYNVNNLPIERIDSTKSGLGNWNIKRNRYSDYVQVNVDVAAINEVQIANVSVYPNPIAEQFTINVDNFTKLQIVDLSGKIVLESTEKIVNSSYLESGMYLLKVYNDQQLIATKSILKN